MTWDKTKKNEAFIFHRQGFKCDDISKKTGIPNPTIRKWIQKENWKQKIKDPFASIRFRLEELQEVKKKAPCELEELKILVDAITRYTIASHKKSIKTP